MAGSDKSRSVIHSARHNGRTPRHKGGHRSGKDRGTCTTQIARIHKKRPSNKKSSSSSYPSPPSRDSPSAAGSFTSESSHSDKLLEPKGPAEPDIEVNELSPLQDIITNTDTRFNKYTRPFIPFAMEVPTLKIGCAGLGRMGKRHADHFLHKVPQATLVAASTPDDGELEWAKQHLEPYGVTLYKSYDKMIKHEGLEAVVIASVTTVHAEQAIKAIGADKHVLCEKPLSTSVEVSQSVVDAAARKPHLKVMCGFSRRFDDSYGDAHTKVENGLIGNPSVFRSQTCDKWDPTGGFIAYAEFSGGIFVDCSIHDIDLCLWFFGRQTQVKSVAAIGITALAPELRKYSDRDNAIGIVEFWGDKVAYFYCSRMMAAGQEDTTEIIGTEGKLTVNMAPSKNLVTIHVAGGVKKEIPQDYFQRFEKAFVTEGAQFVKACLNDSALPLELQEAVRAVNIGCALQESLISGRKIEFDEAGNRKSKAML